MTSKFKSLAIASAGTLMISSAIALASYHLGRADRFAQDRKIAVSHGGGHYDPKSGDWTWDDACPKVEASPPAEFGIPPIRERGKK